MYTSSVQTRPSIFEPVVVTAVDLNQLAVALRDPLKHRPNCAPLDHRRLRPPPPPWRRRHGSGVTRLQGRRRRDPQTGRARRRFLEEARLSVLLRHSNIVQVFDVGIDDDVGFIVMEWVDGIDLVHAVDRLHEIYPA